MEIACALPCEPVSVPMSLLCAEFAVKTQAMVRRLLGEQNIDFASKHAGGDTRIYVPKRHWKATHKRCLDYWERVHGE